MSVNLGLTTSSASSGNGIDVTAVVDQILESKRGPEKIWQSQIDTLTLRSSALSSLNTSISTLSSALNSLKDVLGALTAKVVSSSQPTIVIATADTTAPTGNHSITVTSLATTSSYYTDPIDGSKPLATGTLSLKVGTADSVDIPIDEAHGSTTLSGLVSYINGENLGVSASAIHDANGDRLALVSQTTGTVGDLVVSSDIPSLRFTKVAGANAELTVDGVPISSSSNSVTGVLPGVTMNLMSASPGTQVQLNVGPDIEQAKNAVNAFASAYNAVISAINAQYAVDPNTNTAGALASDDTLRSIQSTILSNVTYSIKGNNGITGLASIGVNMNDDGTLEVDDSKLSDILNNHFVDFQNFFQAADTGYANQFSSALQSLTDSTDGMISLDLTGMKNTQAMLQQQITDLEDRLAVQQVQLIDEYSRIDTALRTYPTLLQQVTSQLASIPTFDFTAS
ncbi:MAG TPA: flagellar filament capping protein FliD [Terriglobales bacterium]|jgi:flagellar hook-associated protein 2